MVPTKGAVAMIHGKRDPMTTIAPAPAPTSKAIFRSCSISVAVSPEQSKAGYPIQLGGQF
jgi:hypothetical protein